MVCNSDEWYSILPGIAILGVIYPVFAPIGVFLLLRFKRQQWNLTFLHGAYKEEVRSNLMA